MKKPTVAQIVAVLELLIRCHPSGMALLVGHEITADEIREIVGSVGSSDDIGVRIMGGQKISTAERNLCVAETVLDVIDEIGGWENVWRSVEELRAEMPKGWWREVVDFVTFIRPGGAIRDGNGGYGGKFFGAKGKHGIVTRTARRRFRELLRVVAVKTVANHSFKLSCESMSGGGPR